MAHRNIVIIGPLLILPHFIHQQKHQLHHRLQDKHQDPAIHMQN
jgi:hypothetical protein